MHSFSPFFEKNNNNEYSTVRTRGYHFLSLPAISPSIVRGYLTMLFNNLAFAYLNGSSCIMVTYYNLIFTCYFLFVTRYLYTLLFFTCHYLLVTRYYLLIFVVAVDNHQPPDVNDQMSKSRLVLWSHMLETLVAACFKACVLSCRRTLQQYSHDTCF